MWEHWCGGLPEVDSIEYNIFYVRCIEKQGGYSGNGSDGAGDARVGHGYGYFD